MKNLEDNPWKTVSTKEIYKNPWITVDEDKVICPDGSPGIYSVIKTRVATGVLALTENNEVYLVGQYRYPTKTYSWEIVEGGSDCQETPLETAQRELKEEAGIIAKSWESLGGKIHLSNCNSSETAYLFIARDLHSVEKTPDHTEVLQVKKVPFSELLEGVMNGTITDALTIMATLLYNAKK